MQDLLLVRVRSELPEVGTRSPVRQNASASKMVELQARDIPAGLKASRLPQQGADSLNLMLQRPCERVEEVVVGNRRQGVHSLSKHENE